MRCLVTGSRSWDDEQTIWDVLDAVALAASRANDKQLVVVHGACPNGADEIADRWVRRGSPWIAVTAERHPAKWANGKGAGFARNKTMVDSSPDLALAFIRDGSRGATHCAELAGEAGIPLRVFHYGQAGVFALGPSFDDAVG